MNPEERVALRKYAEEADAYQWDGFARHDSPKLRLGRPWALVLTEANGRYLVGARPSLVLELLEERSRVLALIREKVEGLPTWDDRRRLVRRASLLRIIDELEDGA